MSVRPPPVPPASAVPEAAAPAIQPRHALRAWFPGTRLGRLALPAAAALAVIFTGGGCERQSRPPDPPHVAADSLSRALTAAADGDYVAAASRFRSLHEMDPASTDAKVLLDHQLNNAVLSEIQPLVDSGRLDEASARLDAEMLRRGRLERLAAAAATIERLRKIRLALQRAASPANATELFRATAALRSACADFSDAASLAPTVEALEEKSRAMLARENRRALDSLEADADIAAASGDRRVALVLAAALRVGPPVGITSAPAPFRPRFWLTQDGDGSQSSGSWRAPWLFRRMATRGDGAAAAANALAELEPSDVCSAVACAAAARIEGRRPPPPEAHALTALGQPAAPPEWTLCVPRGANSPSDISPLLYTPYLTALILRPAIR